MDEVMNYEGTYAQYKSMVDTELAKAAAGFVRIGYLLKIARDTDILKESGYEDVNAFAKGEYGLSKDVVSRYIDINTRYSENGCSERLQERYRTFGYSKLAEMLTLPEAVAEEITPEITREEIREIKREIREEQEITDIEVMMETPQEPVKVQTETEYVSVKLDSIEEKAMFEYFRKNREKFEQARKFYRNFEDKTHEKNKLWEIFAPTGQAMLITRVPQVGKLMVSIKEGVEEVAIINVRTNETERIELQRFGVVLDELTEYEYEQIYGVEKEKVAPAQPEENAAKSKSEEQKTEENAAPFMNPTEKHKETVEKAEEYKESVSEEAAGQETEQIEAAVETEEAGQEKQTETEEITTESTQEAAGQEEITVLEENEIQEEEHKEPEWYGFCWRDMFEAFEELNGFFRMYRRKDMENQIIPRAKLRTVHDNAVNMAAAIEKAMGAGYGK